MSFAILTVVGFYFFFLGHSTLLYYLAADHETLSLRQVVLPWPRRGRFVSVFALLTGVFWMGMLWWSGMPMNWHERNVGWVLGGFIGVPLACYLWCIVRSVTTQQGHWRFSPKQDTGVEITIGMTVVTTVTTLFLIFD